MLGLHGPFTPPLGVGLPSEPYPEAELRVNEQYTTLSSEFPRCVVDLYVGGELVLPRIFVTCATGATELEALLRDIQDRCGLHGMVIQELENVQG